MKELFKIAYDFLKKDNFIGIFYACDTGDSLVCCGGNPDIPFYGCRTVAVDKSSKKASWFVIATNEENEEKFDTGMQVDIPNEYAFKS